MKKSLILFLLLFQFSNHVKAQNNVSLEKLPKNLYRISIGSHYFHDKFINDVVGFNVGLGYERTFCQKWSWSINLEAFFNKNFIPKIKMLYDKNDQIHLTEIEKRFAFSPEIRYYFSKAGNGFYLSNVTNIQWIPNGYLAYANDCMHCSNLNYSLDNVETLSDRLSWGYQKFVNQKMFIGFAISYEFRLSVQYKELIKSPQIAFQIGFNK